MEVIELTKAHKECLRDQAKSGDEPGAVLRDFQMLLDFLGCEGVEAAGKYNLLTIKLIAELDRRLTRPLNLPLQRPQLRSHPYLQGLHLLLRASGLGVVSVTGAKARLVIDPAMRMQWDQLNPTERYFNLLEAWLQIGHSEMVGEADYPRGDLLISCIKAWRSVPASGQEYDLNRPQDVFVAGFYRSFYNVALMDLFGLIRVEQPSRPVAPWCPASLGRVPFGDAVFTLLTAEYYRELFRASDCFKGNDHDEQEEQAHVPRFGVWQPMFQPYFPQWQANLEFTVPEPRDGTFVFRVSLGKIWRLIAMSAGAKMADLVELILDSVNFDSDHLYEFTYRDRTGVTIKAAVHPAMDSGPCAEDVAIGTLPLEPGQTMDLLYDFGDNWHFDVKLERIEPPGPRIKANRIREKHGKAPKQYSYSEW